MNRFLAAIDNSSAAAPVLRMAQALAPVLGARVEAIHVAGDDGDGDGDIVRREAAALDIAVHDVDGDPLAVLTALASADDVVAVAMGARARTGGASELGHVALALADAADKPILLVPPEVVAPARLNRLIAAVKGTHDHSRPLRRAVEFIGQAELDLVVVHVQDLDSIPAFSDQPQYEAAAYADEFLTRHVPGAPRARAQLRFGDPVEELLAAVREENADFLAVGWTQGSRPGRGAVARALAAHSPVPVLLVPLAAVD